MLAQIKTSELSPYVGAGRYKWIDHPTHGSEPLWRMRSRICAHTWMIDTHTSAIQVR